MQSDNHTPFVAVYIITYNHGLYIGQAIDSVLMQQAGFSYKIFIGEDCSTDHTRLVCKEYARKYPNKIELVLHEQNIGAKANAQSIYKKCFESGAKYVAMLEGDDYWIDSYKLQRQVDFLEAHDEYSLIGSNAHELVDKNLILCADPGPREITTEEIVQHGPLLHTCTIMFRNNARSFNNPLLASELGDWSLVFLYSLNGKIKRLKETTGVYRRHGGGIYAPLDIKKKYKENIAFQKLLMREYPQYKQIIQKHIDEKVKQYSLYDYTLKAVLLRKTPLRAFLYEQRVRLNLRKRINSFLRK